jgi:hypothetical protein
MNFDTLVVELKVIQFEEVRREEANYFEAVFATDDLQKISSILEPHLGPPFKPAGKGASGEAKRYADSYGGIDKNQTLYRHKRDGKSEIAMLWPWGSREQITLKLIRE